MEPENPSIRERIKEARRLSEGGNVTDALAIIDSLTAEYPDNERVANHRARLFASHMSPEEALQVATTLSQKFPASYYGAVLQASAYVKLGQGEAALERLDESERLGAPKDANNAKRVCALKLIGDQEEELRVASLGSELEFLRVKFDVNPPKDVEVLNFMLQELQAACETPDDLAYKRYEWLVQKDLGDEAGASLREALAQNPDSTWIKEQLASFNVWEQRTEANRLSNEGRMSDALEILDALSSEHPQDESVAATRATVFANHVSPYEALLEAKAVSRKFPESYFGVLMEARAYLKLRRGNAAMKKLDEAVRLGAPAGEISEPRARALMLVGKREEALRLAGSGADIELLKAKFDLADPIDAAELNLALSELESAGESPERLACRRSDWFTRHKCWQEAEKCLKEALTQNSDSVLLNRQMAWIEYKTGKLNESKLRLERILARTPEHLKARAGIIRIALRRGNIVLAIKQTAIAVRHSLNPRHNRGN